MVCLLLGQLLPLIQSVWTGMGIGVTWYKTWSSTVAILSGSVGEAVSLEGASMIDMCSSGPVQVSSHQARTILCAPSQSHFLAFVEMHVSPLLLSSPIRLDLASPLKTTSAALIRTLVKEGRKGTGVSRTEFLQAWDSLTCEICVGPFRSSCPLSYLCDGTLQCLLPASQARPCGQGCLSTQQSFQ